MIQFTDEELLRQRLADAEQRAEFFERRYLDNTDPRVSMLRTALLDIVVARAESDNYKPEDWERLARRHEGIANYALYKAEAP